MSNSTKKQNVKEKVDNLPFEPGVYMYKDSGGRLLYVGKAKQLRNRVRSYFQDSAAHDGRIKLMVSKIDDLEVIVTDSESEALILENNLIKKHQPRYNIMYRDDKTYPYICITNSERPRVFPTRTFVNDGSTYYGPYDSVGKMRRMLTAIRKSFGLCTCAVTVKNMDRTKNIPKWHSCFNDYLKDCSGDWNIEEYQATIQKVENLLNGKTDQLIRNLKDEMEIASSALEFEQAARLRDSYQAVQRFSQKMKMVDDKRLDRDVFALQIDEEIMEACGVLFKVREGKLIGKFYRFLKNIEAHKSSEMIQAFMEDYYTDAQKVGNSPIPDEVYVSEALENETPLSQYLYQTKGKKVIIHQPQRGEKYQLMQMALSNAKLSLSQRRLEKQQADRERIPHAIKELKEHLHLQRLPRRIECFDNSNIQGSDPVASMVQFVDAKPRKSGYLRFHIKSVEGPDDFASMREIIKRRYSRLKQEKNQTPDLVVIDGGKGQLSSAVTALKEIDFYGEFEIIGLAKRLEEVFVPGRSDAYMIPKTSSALKLLQQVRDEAHRFAITFHRKTRGKRTLQTELTKIEGIGQKKAKLLLSTFGSVKQIEKTSRSTLQETLGKQTGDKVYEYFHP